MDILLIRHGDTQAATPAFFNREKNRPDPPLSELGREQALRLAIALEGSGVDAVYASDLDRTMQTAGIIGSRLGLPVAAVKGLREIDMGRLHHCSWEEIRVENPELADEWSRHAADIPYPGGESGADAENRAVQAVTGIIAGGFEKVAVVTHGGIIRVLVCAMLGLGQEKRFRIGPFENTSVTTLKYHRESKEISVYALNDASHLSDLITSQRHTARR